MGAFRRQQSTRALQSLREFFERGALGTRVEAESAAARLIELFHGVARDVPAYGRFLAAHGVDAASVRTLEHFRRLPVTTKDNYYRQNPLPDLCRHGALDACDMVALSTGSTGEPAVWPRFVSDELGTAARFEQVLAGAFRARERRTLAVICFALGNWVGGLYSLAALRQLAAKGYPITVVSPGNQPAEILRALRALGPHFEQRVLFGYPPFLKDVIDLGQSQGIDWSDPPTRLVMAGEVFSEEWRDWVCHRLGAASPAHSTASLYGTADGGVLANETPLSVRIRRALALRPDAARALFGEARLPTLCQYDPEHRYFEVEDGWLLFSGDGGAPLIRYKILDRGGLISYAAMQRFLAEQRVTLEADPEAQDAELPFVYVFGRSHFAVSFYGANVYPENVSVGLEQPELAAALTGKFVLEVVHGAAQDARLSLSVELARGQSGSDALVRSIQEHVRRHLERLNSEFDNYVPEAGKTPRVELRAFGDPEYFPVGVKHRYTRL
jgi:phenylacetate-CoA ligase